MFVLRKCLAEEIEVFPLRVIRVDPKKKMVDETVEILGRNRLLILYGSGGGISTKRVWSGRLSL